LLSEVSKAVNGIVSVRATYRGDYQEKGHKIPAPPFVGGIANKELKTNKRKIKSITKIVLKQTV
jgi:hypothetical protein